MNREAWQVLIISVDMWAKYITLPVILGVMVIAYAADPVSWRGW